MTGLLGREFQAERMPTVRKFLFTLALILGLSSNAWAMRTPVFGSGTPSTSATNYAGFYSAFVASNDTTVRNISPITGIIEGLYVVANTAPGSGKSYTLTIQKNGADTSVTCTISDLSTSCSDSTHAVLMSAADTYSIKSVPSGTPSSSRLNFSTIFNSMTGGPSIMPMGINSTTPSASVTDNSAITGRTTWNQSGAVDISPTSGTFGNFYVLGVTAPGSGKSFAFTVQKNSTGTTLTCTVSDLSTSCSDTSHSFSVVAGDTLRIQSVPSGTPTSTTYTFGMTFTPTIDGESFTSYTYGGGSPSNTADSYAGINFAAASATSTEANHSNVIPLGGFTAKKIYYSAGSAPGSAKSFTASLRINGSTSSLSCINSGSGGVFCQDSINAVSLSSLDIVNFMLSPSGTPTASSSNRISVVFYIDPNDHIYGGTLYGSKIN